MTSGSYQPSPVPLYRVTGSQVTQQLETQSLEEANKVAAEWRLTDGVLVNISTIFDLEPYDPTTSNAQLPDTVPDKPGAGETTSP